MPTTRRSASKSTSTYNLRKRQPKSDDSADEDYGTKRPHKKAKTSAQTQKKTQTTKTVTVSTVELKVGSSAPIFEKIPDENGKLHSLVDFRGKKLVLFFYPKDNTPGCTTECLSFRDHYNTFKNNNVEVLGVSMDSEKSHLGVTTKKQIPYHLLSDSDMTVINSYGMKSTRGKGAKRATVVIDENGVIEKLYLSKVNPKTHVETIFEDLGISGAQESDEEEGKEEEEENESAAQEENDKEEKKSEETSQENTAVEGAKSADE